MHQAIFKLRSFVTIDMFLQLTNDVIPIVFLHCRRVGQLLLPASLLRGPTRLPCLSSSLVTSLMADSTAFFVTTNNIFYVIRTAFSKIIVH
jgi:hypothetical protein